MSSDRIPPIPAVDVAVDETTTCDDSTKPTLGGLAAELIGGARTFADGRRERRQEREKEREERRGGGGGEQPAAPPEITNVGPIGSLRLPAGYREARRETPEGGPTRIEFNNPKHESMRITFQTWDQSPLSDNSSAAFRRLLDNRRDGPITNQEQIDQLAAFMPAGIYNYNGAMAETPQLKSATLNGRRVVIVENQGHQDRDLVRSGAADPNWRGVTVIIPSDNYRFQYTMTVEGSRGEFRRNFSDLERALSGTRWQRTPDAVLPPMPPPESKK